MAFFKFRKPADEAASTSPAESIEDLRRRARHRLIGAAVLVGLGVIGFPLLFDTQPRPVSVDLPIVIPEKDKVKPLAIPAPPPVAVPQVAGKVGEPGASAPARPASAAPAGSLGPREEVVPSGSGPKVAPAPVSAASPATKKIAPEPAKPASRPEAKASAPKPEARSSAPKADDGAKARALLEGRDPPTPAAPASAAAGRIVVQVGAYADAAKAREVRQKLEKAGLKTYTQVIENSEGRRIRVRVGPYPTRAEAEAAATKVKALDLPAALLAL